MVERDPLPALFREFIVDVLKNYMTYKAYYQLEKTIEDDPAFKGRKAQSRVARYASLHPTAIDQKVEVVVEHFRRHVARELAGQAKAMIVTQSREHALRYWQQLTRYIEDKGYTGLKALVAFSGDPIGLQAPERRGRQCIPHRRANGHAHADH